MRYELRKSTLGEVNNGHTNANSNCYYKGSTVCWAVFDTEENFAVLAMSRKCDAEAIVNFANGIDYDGIGDLDAMARIVFAAQDGSKMLHPKFDLYHWKVVG